MKPSDEKNTHKQSGILDPMFSAGNRTWVIYIICLIIATILWFLNTMNKNYTTTIPHPVEFTDIPMGKYIINNPPDPECFRTDRRDTPGITGDLCYSNQPHQGKDILPTEFRTAAA